MSEQPRVPSNPTSTTRTSLSKPESLWNNPAKPAEPTPATSSENLRKQGRLFVQGLTARHRPQGLGPTDKLFQSARRRAGRCANLQTASPNGHSEVAGGDWSRFTKAHMLAAVLNLRPSYLRTRGRVQGLALARVIRALATKRRRPSSRLAISAHVRYRMSHPRVAHQLPSTSSVSRL